MKNLQKNILGNDLEVCSTNPMTGFLRDGCCSTNDYDRGTHTVCAIVTEAFLNYSLQRGNDLVTPRPEYEFPGLKPGDKWCLCAMRWAEAESAGCAPKVNLAATNAKTLELIPLETLMAHRSDLH